MKRWLFCKLGWHRWWKTNYYERSCYHCNKRQVFFLHLGSDGKEGWEWDDAN